MKVTDKIEITNEDCMELMKRYPDNYFDLAIVDPPYGIDIAKWDKLEMRPKKEYWKQLFRVSKNQIVWGGNYFTDFLPVSRGWLCWDKSVVEAGYLGKKEYDNFELAWISKDVKTKMIRFSDIGNMSGFDGKLKVDYTFKGKIHPTQKHKNLYKWLLDNYAKPNDKILDTHLGSGSIAIACHDYGFELTACELDKEYFDKAIERIKNHTNQTKLF
jgi:site-specific DNA-methyltransferase (adenine-specific)